MTYGYARVSTLHQDLEIQIDELNKAGVEKIICEKKSGYDIKNNEFSKLCKKLVKGDILIVTKLDRIARNTKEALIVLEPILDRGIIIRVLNLGTLENNVFGKFFLQILLAIAEMERNMILERTKQGIEQARKKDPNFKVGPKFKINLEDKDILVKFTKMEISDKEIARRFNVCEKTIKRAKKRFGIT